MDWCGVKFRQVELSEVPWDRLDQYPDRTVFQTREWIAFLADTQNATPVVAELRDGAEVAGYFSGLTVRKLGLLLMGSSFPGWTTPYVGFNLEPGFARRDALAALERFAFDDLRCLHLEVSDRNFTVDDGLALGFTASAYDTYETDLRLGEDQLFGAMNSACRRCIRKAEKAGLRIEEAADAAFAGEYHAQLTDVFAKQGLPPTYPQERVESLLHHLLPSGRLLLLRAISPKGNCVGTGIYPGMNRVAEFWGNASWRAGQHLRPNESLHWYAMRYWKRRGIQVFDWGGGGEYKEKYGVRPASIPWFRKSRYKILATLREEAQRAFRVKQALLGRLKSRRHAAEEPGVE